MFLNLKLNNTAFDSPLKKAISVFLIFIIMANIAFACWFATLEEAKAMIVFEPVLENTTWQQYVLQGIEYALQGAQYIAELAIQVASQISAAIDVWFKEDTLMSKLAYAVGYAMLIALLNKLTQQIINWINGNGTPQFVNDWQSFLRDAVNQAGGKFVSENLGLGILCKPFDMQIKIALGKIPDFRDRAKCTLEDTGNFFSDFNDGGWKRWIQLSEPQNNIYGASLMAVDEKSAREAAAKEAALNEALANAGFLNNKVCVQRTCCDVGGCFPGAGEWSPAEVGEPNCTCDKWITKTPGKIIADLATKAADQTRSLVEAQIADLTDSLGTTWSRIVTPYLTAIVMTVTDRVIKEGISGITGG